MNKKDTVIIPSGCEYVEDFQFENRTDITRLDIPEGVTGIGIGAFMGCTKLSHVSLPGSVKTIGDSAFTSCISLRSVTIQEGVETIGECAFSLCSSLKDIELPLSLTDIDAYAFSGSPCETSIDGQIKELKKRRADVRKKEKARLEAEQKAKEDYDSFNAPYVVYIENVTDRTLAMLTCRTLLGWGSTAFRDKTSSLPIEASSLKGRIAAEELSAKLNKGGVSSYIKIVE